MNCRTFVTFVIHEVLISLMGGGDVYQVYVHAHDLERLDPISNYHNNL